MEMRSRAFGSECETMVPSARDMARDSDWIKLQLYSPLLFWNWLYMVQVHCTIPHSRHLPKYPLTHSCTFCRLSSTRIQHLITKMKMTTYHSACATTKCFRPTSFLPGGGRVTTQTSEGPWEEDASNHVCTVYNLLHGTTSVHQSGMSAASPHIRLSIRRVEGLTLSEISPWKAACDTTMEIFS